MRGRIAIVSMMIGLALLSSILIVNVNVNMNKNSERVTILALTPHAPISINGNSQFNSANGVVSGSGTASNPYIIEGWDINASMANGIYIESSTAFFIVRDCNVHNGFYSNFGIYLFNCTNGVVSNNICLHNFFGIVFDSSIDCKVDNNNCSSDYSAGINLYLSDDNTLSNNTCSNNDYSGYGIHLGSSNNCTVSDNTCSNNGYGIYLASSNNCTVNDSICSSNHYSGIELALSNNCTVNGNECDYSSNNADGISLGGSNNSRVSNNNCKSNGRYGIDLYSSRNNVLSRNQLCNNTGYGVLINPVSTLNRIWNNTFIGNNGAGSSYNSAHIQASDSGTNGSATNNWWNTSNSPHGYGNYWSDWTKPDNNSDGIVDNPYNISVNAKDYYPLSHTPGYIAPITTASLSGTVGTNGWFKSNASVSLSATAGSGVNATFYRIGTSGSWLIYSSALVFSSDGNYIVQFYSRDNSGINGTVKTITVLIDRTAPTMTINQTSGFKVKVDYAVISWNGSDATSGIDHYEVSIDGGAFVSVGTNMSHNFSGLADGAHNITIKIIDVAGNEADRTIQVTIQTIASGAGTSSDLMLYGAIVTITVIILATILIMMRKNKAPPMRLDEMKAEPPEPPTA